MPQPSILFVEDSKADVELAVRALRRDGWQGSHQRVATERELREALASAAPDMIVSDFAMPEFDGMRALHVAREIRPDIPFIFFSGTIGEERAIEAIRLGATDYVLKNNIRRLSTALRRALAEAADRARARAAEEELRESESLKGAILEASLDCLITIDQQGNIVEFNPAAVATFGISREQALGKSMAELIIPSRFREAHRCGLAHYLATGKGPILGKRLELSAIRADGTEFPVELAITPTRSRSASLFTGCLRDITAREAAEAKITRLNRVYAVLSGINALIVRARDRNELFREACRIAVDAGKFPLAWIGLVATAEMHIKPVAWAGDAEGYLERMPMALDASLPEGRGMGGTAIRELKAMVANDIASDPRIQTKKEASERGFRSLVVLPLVPGRKAVGLLALYAEQVGFFDDEEMKLLLELAGDISFALEHIEKAEQLNYLANYDPLTGLPNRALLHERLTQQVHAAERDRRRFALLFLDLERFRMINDTLGRQAGDLLLKQAAERITRATPEPNGVARVGADHFAILVPEVKQEDDLARLIEERGKSCFGEPFKLDRTELGVSAKVGAALYPTDGADADTLLKHAEAALKKAKQSGERYLFYAREMTERVAEKLALENKLRQALSNNEFVLHYQPKVELENRTIVGAEALIRWQSPELGLVPPAKFIALLEETGLILPVGAWALKQAALDYRTWADQGLKAPRIAVNVSAIQLRQRDFVRVVEQSVLQDGAPACIDLEITESLIMENMRDNIGKLKAIRALGASIAIDDFGTGYSSLAYLAKLPVETLKIDRSFIITMLNDPDSALLVQTIISLAHSLKLNVVAEGVDSEDQANLLRLLRCDQMQGYLFSKPLPHDQIAAMLSTA